MVVFLHSLETRAERLIAKLLLPLLLLFPPDAGQFRRIKGRRNSAAVGQIGRRSRII